MFFIQSRPQVLTTFCIMIKNDEETQEIKKYKITIHEEQHRFLKPSTFYLGNFSLIHLLHFQIK